MRGVQIGVLLMVVVGLSGTLTLAASVRNRMIPKLASPSGQPQYYSQQQQPVKIEEDLSSEEEDDLFDQEEPHSFLPKQQHHHQPPSPKVPAPSMSLGGSPGQNSRFSPVRNGGDHRNVPSPPSSSSLTMSARNEERDQELKLEALQAAEEERINLEQSLNAKYFFASAVDDGIMDQSQVRQESRDGSKVKGSYSYSDGFVKRTVTYEADDEGFKILSEESEPIGEGPQTDLINGKAEVHTQVEGVNTQYSINADDIILPGHSSTSTTLAPLPELKHQQQQHQQQQQHPQKNLKALKHSFH